MAPRTAIERVSVSAYTVPTDFPEADGTLAWDETTIVIAEAGAGGETGLGYTYASTAAAHLIHDVLAPVAVGCDAMNVSAAWVAMFGQLRNLGRPGICASAVSAVDIALWDLKARLLGVSLAALLGMVRASVPVYGSGGFTSYSIAQLQKQLAGWVEQGIRAVKMKIGTVPSDDLARVCAARQAIGADAALYVDANGAYSRKQALRKAEEFADCGVSWFEEPVSSDDLDGLRLLRGRAPAGMDIAAGEYGYDLSYFARMLDSVDVLQADATRCGGISGFLAVGPLCEAHNLALSAHTAPSVHAAAACAIRPMRDLEYFHDHARIEQMFFDGAPRPLDGALRPDLMRPGLGLDLKRQDAAPYLVFEGS